MTDAFSKITLEQWVDVMARVELPAITSTAKMLDKFSEDDVSSLPRLSKAILHDEGLSTCLLKVVNSTQYMGVAKVTTISRASVILGIHTVKNICLTAKLVDGLLRCKNLKISVYKRLTQLMANSFYAGLLAKMMMAEYSDETREQAYLAAMFYRIGETAFWSTGNKATEKLISLTGLPPNEFYLHAERELGISFNELSIGLAKKWKLGKLLEKALDDPESRTVEMQIIYLADKLATFIDAPPDSYDEFQALLEHISAIMHISVKRLRLQVEQTREQAKRLLNSYGAFALKDLLKTLPTNNDFIEPALAVPIATKEGVLLNNIKKLSDLIHSTRDINQYLQATLKGIIKSFEFDHTTFFILADNKKYVKSRFSFDGDQQEDEIRALVHLEPKNNLFAQVVEKDKSLLIDDARKLRWKKHLTRDIATIIDDGAICMAPVKVGDKIIGMIIGQVFDREKGISQNDFKNFEFLLSHLNMCLTMVLHK